MKVNPIKISLLIFVNISVFFLIIFALEGYFAHNLENVGVTFLNSSKSIETSMGRVKFQAPNLVNVRAGRVLVDERYATLLYQYSTDDYGRRISVPANNEAQNFAIFLGGSFTFGMGVDDDETLSSQFNKRIESYQAYNYGSEGFGLSQVFSIIDSDLLTQQIKQKKGVAFYIYMNDHLYRSKPSRSTTAWTPIYKAKKDEISYEGVYFKHNPIQFRMYEILNRSFLLRKISKNHLLPLNDSDIDLFCLLLKKSVLHFKKKFAESEFYVVYNDYEQNKSKQILNQCKQYANFTLLDFSKVIDENDDLTIPLDGHPSSKRNQLLSEWLIKKTQLK